MSLQMRKEVWPVSYLRVDWLIEVNDCLAGRFCAYKVEVPI